MAFVAIWVRIWVWIHVYLYPDGVFCLCSILIVFKAFFLIGLRIKARSQLRYIDSKQQLLKQSIIDTEQMYGKYTARTLAKLLKCLFRKFANCLNLIFQLFASTLDVLQMLKSSYVQLLIWKLCQHKLVHTYRSLPATFLRYCEFLCFLYYFYILLSCIFFVNSLL